MATQNYEITSPQTNFNPVGSKTAWGAIFGGTFVYLAIMMTFGVTLASAIFSSSGWTSTGFAIWLAVVGIISLYFAGRATGHLARVTDRNIGMWHGLVTFGMSVFATILVVGITVLTAAPYARAAAANTMRPAGMLGTLSSGGWALFLSLLFGFIGAAIGGAHAAQSNRNAVAPGTTAERPDIRRVA
jgi:hypothetical protein